jgi:FkbM family methyltransferase
LQRVFADIEKGFYVDVGANHDTHFSVTRAFYDRGWRGINIEPVSEWYTTLATARPEDINLNVAVGHEAGIEPFYVVPGTGLSTFCKEYAERARIEHNFTVQTHRITKLTLTQILASQGASDIHFLKIDTEGTEQSVLQGLDRERFRPWVIVVEATEPLRKSENYQQWEELLTGSHYKLVYCDGLNRFYLAAEREHLADRFQYPPNIFDEVVPHHLIDILATLRAMQSSTDTTAAPAHAFDYYDRIKESLERITDITHAHFNALATHEMDIAERDAEIARLHREVVLRDQEVASREGRISELERQFASASQQVCELERQLQSIHRSVSYRLATPLRKTGAECSRIVRKIRRKTSLGQQLRRLEERIRGYRKKLFGKKNDVASVPFSGPSSLHSDQVPQEVNSVPRAA